MADNAIDRDEIDNIVQDTDYPLSGRELSTLPRGIEDQ
jgi:hypothetical protein